MQCPVLADCTWCQEIQRHKEVFCSHLEFMPGHSTACLLKTAMKNLRQSRSTATSGRGERGGLVVEPRSLEREVKGSTSAVLCP